MPKSSKPTAPAAVSLNMSDILRRKGTRRPRFDLRACGASKGDRKGKRRGGRPPRFPGRTGGR